MIKNIDYWQKWENDLNRRTPADFEKNLHVMEAMYEEVKALNLPVSEDPLAGLEADILYAKAINVPTDPHPTRPGA